MVYSKVCLLQEKCSHVEGKESFLFVGCSRRAILHNNTLPVLLTKELGGGGREGGWGGLLYTGMGWGWD